MERDSICKVKKSKGDFDRACDLGYGINLHDCAEDEMRLVIPGSPAYLKFLLERDGFTMLTEPEYR